MTLPSSAPETGQGPATPKSDRSNLVWLLAPAALVAAAVWWLLATNPLAQFNDGAPPVENLVIERTILDDTGLRMLVRAGGSEPMRIAQIQVDASYWEFQQTPPGPIERGATAWLQVPFPWVLGEAHSVRMVTNTGAIFDHPIPVAIATPVVTSSNLFGQAVIGIFVGILPVVVGLLFYPSLRSAGPSVMAFLLAMTIGLLGFLFVDTLEGAMEFAGKSAAMFQGATMVILTAAASFLVLMAVSRRDVRPSGLALATYIALGIGLHNFGEGLAIGAAFAAGAAGLGTFLVLGFALHNVTEGIGIAAPILKERPPLLTFAGLALLAGGPAVIGMWIGSLAFAPHWSALALAIGAGAILQVILEVGGFLMRGRGGTMAAFWSAPVLSGMAAGVAFMYVTAMLVKI